MNNISLKPTPFIISVSLVLAVTIFICAFAASCGNSYLEFNACYYFVCYSMEDNSVSASSMSSAVSNYGGAGYILEYNGAYYVTVSCYYEERDANAVKKELNGRGLKCSVLKIETKKYRLQTAYAKKNSSLYRGNLNTLHSLSQMAYKCANALDTGEYNQTKAKNVINDIKNGLNGLLTANEGNVFSTEIRRLLAECSDAADGYVYSKDLRKLQIAIADGIINAKLI